MGMSQRESTVWTQAVGTFIAAAAYAYNDAKRAAASTSVTASEQFESVAAVQPSNV